MNATTYRLNTKEPHILGLTLLSAFGAMGAILMTPALPNIAGYFNVSVGVSQLTVTSFLLGFALGQLIYGPIANRLGRKPAFYVGIFLATLGSLFSILSSPVESFSLLIIGRLLEAFGSSVGLVVCFTLINDFYFPKEARRVTGLMVIAFAIIPGIAVAVGGLLTQYVGWQGCFYFLLIYGLALIYPATKMPETLSQPDIHALHYRQIYKNYAAIFKNKQLLGFSACSGFSSACIYVFGAEGPFIGIHLLGISPATYGLLGLLPFLGTLIGCLISIRLAFVKAMTMLKAAFFIELIATVFMLFCFVFHFVNLFTLLAPMALLCLGHAILSSTALSLAMTYAEDKANGSAVMNFVVMCMPVLMTFLLGMLHIGAAWVLPLIFMIALGLMLVIYCIWLQETPHSHDLR
ncbi:MAG TPA: multidrug effflux MFS transporter [Gammaproteobacteria bacterium]|nr:multidrug effflux MFS transporter [Gammaproteobacteria bacterium]